MPCCNPKTPIKPCFFLFKWKDADDEDADDEDADEEDADDEDADDEEPQKWSNGGVRHSDVSGGGWV